MKKLLVLYFSGAGATKRVAGLVHNMLKGTYAVTICPVENAHSLCLEEYEALVIGTPAYHAAPAQLLQAFFQGTAPLPRPVPAFLFHTYALWACNTNRILAKQVISKNILPVMERSYRAPASDGALLAPFVPRFFEFEKNLEKKITADCAAFLSLLEQGGYRARLPRFRLSGILNAPNKWAGQMTVFPIFVHTEKCLKCGKCIVNCPHNALEKSESGFPVFLKEKCENCYRCIHHCPAKALSLSKRKSPEKLLTFGTEPYQNKRTE